MSLKVCYFEELVLGDYFKINILSCILYLTLILRLVLTGSEDFSRPLYEILERDYHAIAKVSKEDISARLADKYIANKLEIKVGDPILVRKRFVYDPDGCPLEWNIGYYRADSFTYSLEFERNI